MMKSQNGITAPQVHVGEVYIQLSTVLNPFEKRFAKVIAIKAGYVQFRVGKSEDYLPSAPRSMTQKKFMDTYGPQ